MINISERPQKYNSEYIIIRKEEYNKGNIYIILSIIGLLPLFRGVYCPLGTLSWQISLKNNSFKSRIALRIHRDSNIRIPSDPPYQII